MTREWEHRIDEERVEALQARILELVAQLEHARAWAALCEQELADYARQGRADTVAGLLSLDDER